MKEGWTVQSAADAAGMSERRPYAWLARFEERTRQVVGRPQDLTFVWGHC